MINLKNKNYFNGKTIWLTGASSGIGEALAYQLANSGAKLLLTSRNTNKLEILRTKLYDSKKHRVFACDLSQANDIEACWKRIQNQKIEIDVLISNAGCSQRSLAVDTSIETSRYLMEINFFAPLRLMTFVLPEMQKRKSGQIIVVSSLMGKISTPLRSSYAAAKHALVGYFDSLITENCNSPIQFTMVNPGFINTNMSRNSLLGDGTISNDIRISRKKIMSPWDCAKRILKASSQGKREIYVGGPEIYIALFKRLFPSLYLKLITRVSATR